MPADVRCLAQEAIELAGKAQYHSLHVDLGTHKDARLFAHHAGTHYATIAEALIEALDEGDKFNSQVTETDLLLDEAGVGVAPESVPAGKRLQLRVLSVLADRDTLLADLPHALGQCGCEQEVVARDTRTSGPIYAWPEAHTAAIKRLEARGR